MRAYISLGRGLDEVPIYGEHVAASVDRGLIRGAAFGRGMNRSVPCRHRRKKSALKAWVRASAWRERESCTQLKWEAQKQAAWVDQAGGLREDKECKEV